MNIDPRTLRPVTTPSDCHLIPECIKYCDPPKPVSTETVPLDGPFDNKIGSRCDHHLKAYLDLVVGRWLRVDVAIEGGAQKLGVTLEPCAGKMWFKPSPSRRRGKPPQLEGWLRKALGMRDDGLVRITGGVGRAVDIAKARLSIVNSAILTLYHLDRRDFGPEFDWARGLLKKVVGGGDLDQSDLSVTEQHTELLILLATEKIQGPVNPGEFRDHYRPDVDMLDGVLEGFPNDKCVSEDDEALVIRLPYGKGLRGVVRFPKKPSP